MEKMVTKISVKDVVGCVVGTLLIGKPEGSKVELLRIIGICTDSKTIPTAFGDGTKLRGTFKAISKINGDIFLSSSCYLPDAATDMILSAFSPEMTGVHFALDIGAEARVKKDGTIGYIYTVTPLTKPSENNPLALLEQQIGK